MQYAVTFYNCIMHFMLFLVHNNNCLYFDIVIPGLAQGAEVDLVQDLDLILLIVHALIPVSGLMIDQLMIETILMMMMKMSAVLDHVIVMKPMMTEGLLPQGKMMILMRV